jgi:hypothetical protein
LRINPRIWSAVGYCHSGCTCLFRLSTTSAYASMIFSMSCGHTLFFIQVLVQATRPCVSNSLEYRRYRHSDSASSGSLEMSDKMNTRGFCAYVWSLSVAILEDLVSGGKKGKVDYEYNGRQGSIFMLLSCCGPSMLDKKQPKLYHDVSQRWGVEQRMRCP